MMWTFLLSASAAVVFVARQYVGWMVRSLGDEGSAKGKVSRTSTALRFNAHFSEHKFGSGAERIRMEAILRRPVRHKKLTGSSFFTNCTFVSREEASDPLQHARFSHRSHFENSLDLFKADLIHLRSTL